MTLQTVRQLLKAEKKAKDAYYAVHGKVSVVEAKPLYEAMVKATKARQDAMAILGKKLGS